MVPPFAFQKRADADLAIEIAVRRSFGVYGKDLGFLPAPVGYRAMGAVQAWSDAFRLTGTEGARWADRTADTAYEPLLLTEGIEGFVRQRCTEDFDGCFGDLPFPFWIVEHSMLYQAFWARRGMLYEPTKALHDLLEASDIADDIPVGQLKIPAPAFCIVPDASTRASADLFTDAMIFEHGGGNAPGQRWLTLVFWRRKSEPDLLGRSAVLCEKLRLRVDGKYSDGPLGRALDNISRNGAYSGGKPDEAARKALSYVAKLLLYLSLEGAQVVHERPYSTAPRSFPGLGQRKRNERLQQIEKLYDRYLVGPAVWNEAPEMRPRTGSRETDGVRAHWRRGHFRMQPFGPAASQRKMIFVMPTLVRPGRLSAT